MMAPPSPLAPKTAMFDVDSVELVAEEATEETMLDELLLVLFTEDSKPDSATPLDSVIIFVSELPDATTHDLAVLSDIVVISAAPSAAVDNIVEIDAGIHQVLAPTVEHNEVAQYLAL